MVRELEVGGMMAVESNKRSFSYMFRLNPRGPKNLSLLKQMCPVKYQGFLRLIFPLRLSINFQSFFAEFPESFIAIFLSEDDPN